MKKVTIIFALIFTLFTGGRVCAQTLSSVNGFSADSGHFTIDARDEQNRPIESITTFRDTVFSRVYSEISPFGITRRLSPPASSEELLPDYSFDLPRLMLSFIPSSDELLPLLFERVRHPTGTSKIVFTVPLLGTFMLLFCIKLQSTKEPRFRVPVFLE